MLSNTARRLVRGWTLVVLLFLYAPLLLVVINAFNTSRTFAFPRRDSRCTGGRTPGTATACGSHS